MVTWWLCCKLQIYVWIDIPTFGIAQIDEWPLKQLKIEKNGDY